ncbi:MULTISPECIES: DRTGG domain-containing protein [Clostridium]|uniref:Cobalt-dependent inorganic pyrophosphatase n=2 Tax=Clostridium TaxID=1485 RepID=A0A151ALT8_9CLOT|nr:MULTISPECIES: DRTGG domain-containing protein [Clostridium]KYH28490.1 cobalt-dependent inorganic pyrophosphatase [Clostridium colicanis DSM 13634]MBE6042996.1 CBS domain-containing protein [Clostridium thermopalmarium]PRR69095.1 Cobalt-dependent inorganic pyrophosphatase [Clostridium thermopalmarium DSM 5974]PVZ26554.1 putative transcriptional regulator [Clostridium thermopalmarium DSM 5974]
MSKHEDIINHIASLQVGTKISVRSIATELGVSDGTAYRAIKDAENIGIVSTIPRVGTIRIEKVEKKSIESLSYAEVVNIIEGTVLGGRDGIHKKLNKFVIGAMKVNDAKKYMAPGCLVIVGNREDIQKVALENECSVLITGGFECSDRIKKLGDEKCLPIISTSYDTFTVAAMIDRALSESLIKKDIILVEDIMETKPEYLKATDSVDELKRLIEETTHERYPVVDDNMNVVGIVTIKDLPRGENDNISISKIMIKNPITVTGKTTVAYTAHVMGWEGIELCPVVNGKKLIGVVGRQDVIKALQYVSRQPQVGETIEDLILRNFQYKIEDDTVHFSGKIIPEMLDQLGTASWSSLNMLLSAAGILTLRRRNGINISVDSVFTYFMKPVQMDSIIEIATRVIDMGRSFCKVDIEMYKKKNLIAKSMISAKILR